MRTTVTVRDIKVISTKKGDEMAILSATCGCGLTSEVIVFNNIYKAVKHLLYEDASIELEADECVKTIVNMDTFEELKDYSEVKLIAKGITEPEFIKDERYGKNINYLLTLTEVDALDAEVLDDAIDYIDRKYLAQNCNIVSEDDYNHLINLQKEYNNK